MKEEKFYVPKYAIGKGGGMIRMKLSTGIILMSLLFLVFFVLKLTGYIDWPWFIVTIPLWGGIGISGCIIGLVELAWRIFL